jgi:glycosyl transferase family 25
MIHFDNAVCINLERRPDRWELAEKEFDSVGLIVRRWIAHDGAETVSDEQARKYRGYKKDRDPKSIIGCLRSHKEVLEWALDRNLEYVVIFEDDVQFEYEDFMDRVRSYYTQLPEDWLMWFLGCVPRKIEPYSRNLRLVHNCWTTHAYMVRKDVYRFFINLLEDENKPIDLSWGPILKSKKVFMAAPILCTQNETYSDIMMKSRSPFKGKNFKL